MASVKYMGYLLGGTQFEGQFHAPTLYRLLTPHSLQLLLLSM